MAVQTQPWAVPFVNPWILVTLIKLHFYRENLFFQVLKGMKGDDPEIHVNRWKLHALNIKTEDEAALDWLVWVYYSIGLPQEAWV